VQLGGGARIQSFFEKPSAEQLASMTMSMDEVLDFYNECNVDEVPFQGACVVDRAHFNDECNVDEVPFQGACVVDRAHFNDECNAEEVPFKGACFIGKVPNQGLCRPVRSVRRAFQGALACLPGLCSYCG